MSEPTPARRTLHLIVEGFPPDKLPAAKQPSDEIFKLTEATAREALEKIFEADSVAVWGEL